MTAMNPTELIQFAQGMDPYVRSRGLERPLSPLDLLVALAATREPDLPETWVDWLSERQVEAVAETVNATKLVIDGIRGVNHV